jgi:hypothetical protein
MRKPAIEEFDVSEKGVVHRPTEARFVCHPGKPTEGFWTDGALGRPHGSDYDPDEVKNVMRRLWADHLLAAR